MGSGKRTGGHNRQVPPVQMRRIAAAITSPQVGHIWISGGQVWELYANQTKSRDGNLSVSRTSKRIDLIHSFIHSFFH